MVALFRRAMAVWATADAELARVEQDPARRQSQRGA